MLKNAWNRKYLFSVAIFISVTYLMYYYRNVGLQDGYVYIQAGESIAQGENPYTEGSTRSGTISSLLIYLISLIFPGNFDAQAFQILNFICVAWFIWVIKGEGTSYENYLLMILVTFWTSPFREMLATNQVNALILGLLATSMHLGSKCTSSHGKFYNGVVGLCLALAIDIKPHLLLIVLLAWTIIQRRWSILVWTTSLFITLHALVNIYIGEITEITWLQRVRGINQSASTTELGDSVSIWPIFQRVFPQWVELVPRIALAAFLLIGISSILFALKRNTSSSMLLAFAAPGFYIYFHFYDMIPLAIIFVVMLVIQKAKFPSIVILSVLIIPKEFTSARNLALVAMITILVSWNSNLKLEMKKIPIREYMGYSVICIINSQFFLDARLTQSIFVTELFFMTLSYTLFQSNKVEAILDIKNPRSNRQEIKAQ